MKDLVGSLLEREDAGPLQIIYFPADTLTLRDLRRYFAVGRSLTSAVAGRGRVWLVDEVTAVSGWTSLVTELRDNTALAAECVVVTGSSSADAKQALKDLGAGRTGGAVQPFRTLHPMSFGDFVHLQRSGPRRPDPLMPAELLSETAREVIDAWSVLTADLDAMWQDYLEVGGFPRAVAEHRRLGGVSDGFLEELPHGFAPTSTRLLRRSQWISFSINS